MSFFKQDTLGVLACSGGEAFANGIISALKGIYVKQYHKTADKISEKYNISKDHVFRDISFSGELHMNEAVQHPEASQYRPPRFRIPVQFTQFANSEIKAEVLSTVRGKHIFIVQDVENRQELDLHDGMGSRILSVNDHLMCLFVTIDAVVKSGAEYVTLILPTYPYSRQHKRSAREALTAAWFGQTVENMGVDRIITLDIHSSEIANTFRQLSLENLHASYQIIKHLTKIIDIHETDLVVVSPDTGAVSRNKFFASSLKRPLALLYKERDYTVVSKNAEETNITSMRLLGDVEGKTVLMADDLLGTGGTLLKAFNYLNHQGASKIIGAISLPLFSKDAVKHFDSAYSKGLFYRIIGTNAVTQGGDLLEREWFVNCNVSSLFAQIIFRVHHGKSISPLLENAPMIQKFLSKHSASSIQELPDIGLQPEK